MENDVTERVTGKASVYVEGVEVTTIYLILLHQDVEGRELTASGNSLGTRPSGTRRARSYGAEPPEW